jgi:hypothetical protein
MNKIPALIICLLICLTVVDSLDAQRRRRARQKTDDTEKTSFAEKINYEIRLGNIAFGGGFALDLKPTVGYKLNKTLTLGGGFRLDYDFVNSFPNDFSFLSYGPLLLARAKVTSNIYVQGEYTFFNFDTPQPPKITENFFSFGAGYVQGGDNWKYSLEGMFVASDLARNFLGNSVEFWFVFSKNF